MVWVERPTYAVILELKLVSSLCPSAVLYALSSSTNSRSTSTAVPSCACAGSVAMSIDVARVNGSIVKSEKCNNVGYYSLPACYQTHISHGAAQPPTRLPSFDSSCSSFTSLASRRCGSRVRSKSGGEAIEGKLLRGRDAGTPIRLAACRRGARDGTTVRASRPPPIKAC